ncbi:MAG: ATP-dependent helicase [Clostridiales bacterium]|nr:ATP-dependent helicase [Clostridiales bacterium]
MLVNFTLDMQKIALSSRKRFYKTEGFISSTRKTAGVDAFVSRVAEGIFKSNISIPEGGGEVKVSDGLYTLYVCRKDVYSGDIVFYGFESGNVGDGGVDRSLQAYFSQSTVSVTLGEAKNKVKQDDLVRLYLVSDSDGAVNFPYLNDTQRKIVETEDSNMLVRGVAGSGKTNVCVEKIVYCACRSYRGSALYTTFSRGLLTETKNRVGLFVKNINDFISAFERGAVVFLDDDHKKAVENKLGILFSVDDDGEIISALKRISAYLSEKVDYFLIEDIYADYYEEARAAGESVFNNEYLGGGISPHITGAIDKIKNVSTEIIYKEIYGMIFGKYELSSPRKMMTKDEYVSARRDSFTPRECEIIYSVAVDYAEFMEKRGYLDNNLMSRAVMEKVDSPKYSIGVIDEVQDFTQVNLALMKTLCRKLFCVGDALQMINPSYFGFGYLKRLMYGDVTGVSELKHNYRSTQKLEQIAEKLGEMNISRFGTHSFVISGKSVPSPLDSEAVFVKDKGFSDMLKNKRFENLTVVVGSQKKKERLKKSLGKIEVLTVAEIKGLERGTVILVDILSDNADKWRRLNEMSLNRKTADENSVYRYYFNLFYVGVSRARQYLVVAESDYPKFFDKLFDECFVRKNRDGAIAFLKNIAGRIELDDEEFIERIESFCALEQYDNARSAADRLSSDELREKKLVYISVHEKYLRYGAYRDAGIEYWRHGMDAEARECFTRSGDEKLFPLMDACLKGGSSLDPEIVRFYTLVDDNDVAKNIILETLNNDCKDISAAIKSANAILRRKS